jgi:SAM-dependent methyltransferase
MSQQLHARVKSFAERVLPSFLRAWLDPVEKIIEGEVAAAAAQANSGHIVLDAGAGEAGHRKYFARGSYVALDSGTGDPAWNYSKLDIRGDLEQLPLRCRSVDCILCMVVLEHTRNPRQVLTEFARALKEGGTLRLVVPFLWEEHQAPHDYFRFTRYGVAALFDSLPLRIELLRPMGGFFWVCARRSVNLLGFFQRGWKWALFVLLAPFFGLMLPLILFSLDGLDRQQNFSLGFVIRATKIPCGSKVQGPKSEVQSSDIGPRTSDSGTR